MKKEEIKIWKKTRDTAIKSLKEMKVGNSYLVFRKLENGAWNNYKHAGPVEIYGVAGLATKMAEMYFQPNQEELMEEIFNKWLLFYDMVSKQEVTGEEAKIKVKVK